MFRKGIHALFLNQLPFTNDWWITTIYCFRKGHIYIIYNKHKKYKNAYITVQIDISPQKQLKSKCSEQP